MLASDDDVFMLAAALAYYFFFSIFPLLVFVLAMASLLPVQGLEAWLLSNAQLSGEELVRVRGLRCRHGGSL